MQLRNHSVDALASGDLVIPANASATGIRRSKVLMPDVNLRKIRHQAEHIQKPNDHEDHHNAIQNGFDRPLHGDQIDQPQKYPHYY
jgi:hypothetical protein